MSVRPFLAFVLLCVAVLPVRAQVTFSGEVRFAPPAGEAGFFGGGVSISDDGQVAAIGAFESRNDADRLIGRAFVYVRSGDAWTLGQTLTPPNDATFTSFGTRTALSANGSLLAVSATRADSDAGAVHLYARLGDTWTLASTIPGPSDAGFRSNFGWSLDLTPAGDYLIVGANAFEPDPDASPRAATGAAFVYSVAPGGASWTRQARFLPDGSADFDGVGFSVALSDDGATALVGAPGAGVNGETTTYTRTGTTWAEQQRLEIFGATFGETNRKFGQAVAISGDGSRVFVAAPDFRGFSGGVYTFDLSFGAWDEGTRILQPTDEDQIRFGTALSISSDGQAAFFGVDARSPLGGGGTFGAGKVFRYAETDGSWAHQATIEPSDGAEGDVFGSTLAATPAGDYLLVGATLANARDGAAYGYARRLASLSLTVEERIVVVDGETLTLQDVLERLRLVVEERIGVTDQEALTLREVLETLQLIVTEQIGVRDGLEATFADGSAVLATQFVSGDGVATLARAGGLAVAFDGVTGMGDVAALFLDAPPADREGIAEDNVSRYRWIIQSSPGLSFGSGTEVRFDVGALQGVSDPAGVVVYKRSTPGSGPFEPLATRFDPSAGQIVASGVDSFSEFVLASSTNALPVELVDFSAQADGPNVVLRWQTASETNNAGFSVEQTTGDDAAWTTVAFVDGNGTTLEARSYALSLPDLAPDRYRFRLKQIDTDGAFAFSPVVETTVAVDGAYWLSPLAPNPARTRSRLTLRVSQPQHVRADLYDATGRRVRTVADEQMDADRAHALVLDASSLATGLYLLRIEGERFSIVRTWSIVR